MPYHLSFHPKQDYLHVKVTGENTLANVLGYLEEVLHKCKEDQFTRLLIEERLDGPRLNTLKVFQAASEGSRPSLGLFKAIAYVDLNQEGDLMHFAETVAINRALPVRVFPSVAEAEAWLRAQV